MFLSEEIRITLNANTLYLPLFQLIKDGIRTQIRILRANNQTKYRHR
jgi:hypothetical protein